MLGQKALRCLEAHAKRRSTERQIVGRFRQFHARLQLTKLFLQWAEAAKNCCKAGPERDAVIVS